MKAIYTRREAFILLFSHQSGRALDPKILNKMISKMKSTNEELLKSLCKIFTTYNIELKGDLFIFTEKEIKSIPRCLLKGDRNLFIPNEVEEGHL